MKKKNNTMVTTKDMQTAFDHAAQQLGDEIVKKACARNFDDLHIMALTRDYLESYGTINEIAKELTEIYNRQFDMALEAFVRQVAMAHVVADLSLTSDELASRAVTAVEDMEGE